MGMYTELIFGASLENMPDHVVEALDYVINDKENVSQEALQFADEYDLSRIFWDRHTTLAHTKINLLSFGTKLVITGY